MATKTRTRRRSYGEGSIYQECDVRLGCPPLDAHRHRPPHRCKGPWVGAFSHGYTERGTPRRYKVKAPTEAQARTRLRKRIGEVVDGTGGSVDARTIVKQWSEEWLAMAERTQRPGPFATTTSAVRRWVVPAIGHKRLADLSPADLRKVANAQRAAGLKPSTQRRTHSVLITMLKAARADGHAVPAIVVEAPAPASNASDRTDLPVEAAMAMLGVAAGTPQGSRWAAAFLQGLRQAEALGLTWDEVDLDAGLLTISWQLQPLPYRIRYDRTSGFRVPDNYEAHQLKDRWHLVRPKTRAGWRVIPLVPWMVSALAAWRDVAPENAHGLVWPTLAGDPCDPKHDDEEWRLLQVTAAVQLGDTARHPSGRWYTVHEARHTTATLLLEAGVDPAVIIAILGHSSMLSTKGYLHVKTAPLADAMSRVARLLELEPGE